MSYRVGSSYFFELPFEVLLVVPFLAPPFLAPPLELFFAPPFDEPDDFFAVDLEVDFLAAFFVAIGCCCSFLV